MLFLLWVGSRFRDRLRPGDIAMLFFIWYGLVRFLLETLRSDNWTFFGIPTAMVVSALFIGISGAALVWRHRPGHPTNDRPPTFPKQATWGAVGDASALDSAIDEHDAIDDDDIDDDAEFDDEDDVAVAPSADAIDAEAPDTADATDPEAPDDHEAPPPVA